MSLIDVNGNLVVRIFKCLMGGKKHALTYKNHTVLNAPNLQKYNL